jgi:hypothetical protein
VNWTEKNVVAKQKENYDNHKHQDMVIIPQKRAPSIPARKMGPNSYTGVKGDTIGPASYDPKEINKPNVPHANFQASKIKRSVFAPTKQVDNAYPAAENPGPGQYNTASATAKKDFNSNGLSSVFLSKVPNCKDL